MRYYARLLRFGWTLAATLSLLLSAVPAAAAQTVSGADIQRQIRQSGLTPEQIRQRLSAAGYSSGLLDAYLRGGSDPVPEPSSDILRALRALSPGTLRPEGVMVLPVDTGVVDSVRLGAEALRREAERAAASDTTLRVFGLDVFRGSTSQFQPLLAGPVPETYRLGAGDVLVLVLSGDVELVHTIEVTRDGFVLVPQVGQLYVASLTMSQLKQVLRQRLGASYSGIRSGSTRYDVTIARLRTNQVYVVGEVAQPGSYQLASVATVLNALYAAGGPTERANLRQIRVQRSGQTVATFDLYEYLLRGNVGADVTLEMGDVVFVGVHGVRAVVRGAVVRPAIYELAPGQTLTDLVAAAGGFRADASLRRIAISRIVPPGSRAVSSPDRVVLDVPVEQVVGGQAPPVRVESGDEVQVFEVPSARRAVVQLRGAVYLPGTYGWRPGLRISEVVRLAGGIRPAVYSEIAHIERLNPADSTRFILRVPVPVDSVSAWTNDIELMDYDIITLYAREDLRDTRSVQIAGVVGNPGEFPFSSGMTLRDLVLQAGGLRDGAYLDSVEIARLPSDRRQGQLSTTLRVSMDSTYLPEPPGSDFKYLPGTGGRGSGTPEIELEPFDKVTVFRQPDFELQRVVRIAGEVVFPGQYALESRDERLSSLVGRAGGLSPTAFVDGVRLERHVDSIGRVDVDLREALRRPGSLADPILRPGDVVTVPEYNGVVRVLGAVVAPVSVQHREGMPMSYYIANAGGLARDADKGRISVRYANGSADITRRRLLLFRSTPEVGPGATIFVPVKPEAEPFRLTEFLAATASIVASTVAIIAIATR